MKINFLILILLGASLTGLAQNTKAKLLQENSQKYLHSFYYEKPYIQTDKEVYIVGELIKFKLYIVEGTFHHFTKLSEFAYIELIGPGSKPVYQSKISLENGLGTGNILVPRTYKTGDYYIKVYTKWMLNEDLKSSFFKQIKIIYPYTATQDEKLFTLKDTSKLNMKFFPEGGNLVAGFKNRIAFKVENLPENVTIDGVIVDEKDSFVVEFNTEFDEIGCFQFTPSENIKYYALLKSNNNTVKRFLLPEVKSKGYVFSIIDQDTEFKIQINSNLMQSQNLYLAWHCRGNLLGVQELKVFNGLVEYEIDKSSLSAGINSFAIFDHDFKPVAERLVFCAPDFNNQLEIQGLADSYKQREKVELNLQTRSVMKESREGNYSVSVSLKAPWQSNLNILKQMYLSSDLYGELPNITDIYCRSNIERKKMDLIMLVHGWRKFSWQDIADNKKLKLDYFPDIKGFVHRGTIRNQVTGKYADRISVYCSFIGEDTHFYSTKTNQDGNFAMIIPPFKEKQNAAILLNDPLNQYQIDLEDLSGRNTNLGLEFQPIDSVLKDHIEVSMVNQQIYEAYNSMSQTKKLEKEIQERKFYGKPDKTIILSDYIELKDLKEVFAELMPSVMFIREGKANKIIIIDNETNRSIGDVPGFFVDGVPVFNVQTILNLPLRNIEKIHVFNSKYSESGMVFDGILDIESKGLDGKLSNLPKSTVFAILEGIQSKREYAFPDYATINQKESKTPDFRNNLYWNPNVNTQSNGESKISFYTGDNVGKYELKIEGFMLNGCPMSYTTEFDVKK